MSWTCPECGFKNADESRLCVCGYQTDEFTPAKGGDWESSGLALKKGKPPVADSSAHKPRPKSIKSGVPDRAPQGKDASGDEMTVREMESWKFSYSDPDRCIYVGTPALHPFRLRLSMDDLEELLEFMYEHLKTGKSLKKVTLEARAVREIVEMVEEIIEAKRAQMKLTFSDSELGKIAEIINRQFTT